MSFVHPTPQDVTLSLAFPPETFSRDKRLLAAAFLFSAAADILANILFVFNIPYMPTRFAIHTISPVVMMGSIVLVLIKYHAPKRFFLLTIVSSVLILLSILLELNVFEELGLRITGLSEPEFEITVKTSLADTVICMTLLLCLCLYVSASQRIAVVGKAKEEVERGRESAEAASRAKSEFLANMSHEIRTPMTAILGYAELLLDPQLSRAERDDSVRIISQNGKHLLSVLNDILDLSKIEAGKMAVERHPCSPCAIVKQVASLMRVHAEEKNLYFETCQEGPIPETIQSDETRLRQVLMNLVGNAIKFTHSGSVRLIMTLLEPPECERPLLCFEVIDTGIGMTAEQRKKLFSVFSQGDSSTTRKFGGTGLGLTISKRFAEMLGGGIFVQTEVDVGSSFICWVETGPLENVRKVESSTREPAAPAPAPTVSEEPRRSEGPARLAGRVLLAEDVAVNRKIVSIYLTRAGAAVETAENGRIAVDKAAAAQGAGQPFDLVILDMQMPELDGYGAAAELRRIGYNGPIVALTGSVPAGDQEECLRAGCTEFLPKPVDRKALLKLAQRYLAGVAVD